MKTPVFLLFLLYLIHSNCISQSTVSAQVSVFDISAPQLDTIKTIWIYLPKTYHESKKTYPVIYMFDAQNLFDAEHSYVGEWQVDEYLDTLHNKEAIIVGIEHGNEKRIEELTPFVHETYGGGKGSAFLEFIKFTLKPHIDLSYRTIPEADQTSIIGSSLGGLMAFYAVIKYPEVFTRAGILSPAFWINPDIFEFASECKLKPNQHFYFLAGTDESETMIPNIDKMISILNSKGIAEAHIEKVFIDDGEHNETLWRKSFPFVYDWLMRSE